MPYEHQAVVHNDAPDSTLPYAFWHRSPEEMTTQGVITRQVGPYTVRTWLNPDGKPVATGWFRGV